MCNRNITWMVIILFFAFDYVLRIVPGYTVTYVMRDFNITSADVGRASGMFYLGYAIAHIPMGLLVNKYGIKVISVLFSLLANIGVMCTAFSHNPILLMIGRFIIGISAAVAIVGVYRYAQMFYYNNFAFVISISIRSFMFLSSLLASWLVHYVIDLGWHSTMYIVLVFGTAITILLFVTGISRKEELSLIENSNHHLPMLEVAKTVLQNWHLWYIGMVGGLVFTASYCFAEKWAYDLFKDIYGYPVNVVSFNLSSTFVGGIFGTIFIPFITRRLKVKPNITTMSCIIITVLSMCILIDGHNYVSQPVAVIAMFLIGTGANLLMALYTQIMNTIPQSILTLGLTFVNMLCFVIIWTAHNVFATLYTYLMMHMTKTEALFWVLRVVPFCVVVGGVLMYVYILITAVPKSSQLVSDVSLK